MKPKGSQFSQLEMFPETYTAPEFADMSPLKPAARRSPDGPFHTTTANGRVWQSALPNAIPLVRRMNDEDVSESTERGRQWVATTDLATEQPSVDIRKLNDLYHHDRDPHRETADLQHGYSQSDYERVPSVIKFNEAQHGEDMTVVLDGNHRISVDRAQGKMFHRVNVWEAPDFAEAPAHLGGYRPDPDVKFKP